MKYDRLLTLSAYKSTAFIFGPRMTGKTSLLRLIPHRLFIDLLDPKTELTLRSNPENFWQQVNSIQNGETIIIDEIQKLPVLLDYVQMGIDQRSIRFLLSGSSARKLKRGAANLLGGRALDLRLHPLTHVELKNDFDIRTALAYGTLPKIYTLIRDGRQEEATLLLSSYYTTYIKEEIQAEALVRNLAGFQRFLPIAASADAREIAYSKIGQDCSVPDSTVKDFFSIVEDTLLGRLLWPYDKSERKKAHPKFYFFDCGVTRMLLNRIVDPPTGQELGLLFESWFINEIFRLKDYFNKQINLSFWRQGDLEVDLVTYSFDKMKMAIEIKSGDISDSALRSLRTFKKAFPSATAVVASLRDEVVRKTEDGILILPWKEALGLWLETA